MNKLTEDKIYEVGLRDRDTFICKSKLEPMEFMEYLTSQQFVVLDLLVPSGLWTQDNRFKDDEGSPARIDVDIDTYIANRDDIQLVGFLKNKENAWDGKTTRLLSDDEI